MIGMLTNKRMMTGVLAGMALLATFLVAPQKAHASYSLPVPTGQTMKYKDSDGIGSLSLYKTGWNSKYHVYEVDVELCQNGDSFCGCGYRWRVCDPCDYWDWAIDCVDFVIYDCYGHPFEFKGYIYYNGHCDICGDGDYGCYGGSLSKWWQVYN